jgi:hypothetical protein
MFSAGELATTPYKMDCFLFECCRLMFGLLALGSILAPYFGRSWTISRLRWFDFIENFGSLPFINAEYGNESKK